MALKQDSVVPEQSFDENANVIKNDELETGAKSLLEQLTGTKNLDSEGIDLETSHTEIPTVEILPESENTNPESETIIGKKVFDKLMELAKDDELQELQEDEIQEIENLATALKSNGCEHDNVNHNVNKDGHELDDNEGKAAVYLSEVEARIKREIELEAALNTSDQVFTTDPEPSENDSAVLTFGGEVLDISDTPFDNTSAEKDANDEDQPKVIISSTSPKKKPVQKVRLDMRNQNSWTNNYTVAGTGRERDLPNRRPLKSAPPPPGFENVRPLQRPRQFSFNQYHMNPSNHEYNGHSRQQSFYRYNGKQGYQSMQNQKLGYSQNYQNNNSGGHKTSLAQQLTGAAKSIEQQFFNNFKSAPNFTNRYNQYGNNNQMQSYRNYNPNQNSRGQNNNRGRKNPSYDFLNEIMQEVETEAPGRIVNILVGLKPSAARKLCINNFGSSYYELKMRLPVSTPISVVKRIFLVKFHMTMLIRVSIYSTGK